MADIATPLALNHIGMTVPDIRAAVAWYGRVLGFRCISEPHLLVPKAPPGVAQSPYSMGPRFRKAWHAHLVTANGVGLEMFEFVDPPMEKPADNLEFWKHGYWHLCFTDPDIEGFAAKVVAAGGRQRMPVHEFVAGTGLKHVYLEDPWANVFEVFTHSYEQSFANRPMPAMPET